MIKEQTTPNQGIFAGTRCINFPGKNLMHAKPERFPLYDPFFIYKTLAEYVECII